MVEEIWYENSDWEDGVGIVWPLEAQAKGIVAFYRNKKLFAATKNNPKLRHL